MSKWIRYLDEVAEMGLLISAVWPRLSKLLPMLKSIVALKPPSAEALKSAADAVAEFETTVNQTYKDEVFFEQCRNNLSKVAPSWAKWEEQFSVFWRSLDNEPEKRLALRKLTYTTAPDLGIGTMILASIAKEAELEAMRSRFNEMDLNLAQAKADPTQAMRKLSEMAKRLYNDLGPEAKRLWDQAIASLGTDGSFWTLGTINTALTAPRGEDGNGLSWLAQLEAKAEAEQQKWQKRR